MGILERAIRRGISKGVGDAIGRAVQNAVEPKATELANRAANSIDQAARNAMPQSSQVSSSSKELEGALGNLRRSVESYATEAAKNMKICPACGEPSTADKKFCPNCGGMLPSETVAQGAVCSVCSQQNTPGTKFCANCGAKLPAAIQEEQAAQTRDADMMSQWDGILSQYPKWNCGGSDYNIEQLEDGYCMFAARFNRDHVGAKQAVVAYRQLLQENGFRMAGQYPSVEHLYKKIGGLCYHVDTEHCFDGDSDCPTIYFSIGEPSGGFDYVKPEPKKKVGFKDLFNF